MSGTIAPKSKLIQTLAHDSTTFGGGSAENMTAVRVDEIPKITVAFKNTCDQAVTVTFEASYDSTFSDAWTLPDSLLLADGSGSDTYDYTTLTSCWTYIRPVATPGGNPTEGQFDFWFMGGA